MLRVFEEVVSPEALSVFSVVCDNPHAFTTRQSWPWASGNLCVQESHLQKRLSRDPVKLAAVQASPTPSDMAHDIVCKAPFAT